MSQVIRLEDISAGAKSVRRIVVAGDFSSGKSTCVNLMLGSEISKPAVAARRSPLVRLRHGRAAETWARQTGMAPRPFPSVAAALQSDETDEIERLVTLPMLQGLEIVEFRVGATETINSRLMAEMRGADHLVWCTIGSQAWRLTEKTAFEALRRRYRGPATLVVSRTDLLRSDEDREKIRRRLVSEGREHFDNIVFIGLPGSRSGAVSDPEVHAAAGGGELVRALSLPQPDLTSQPQEPNPAESVDETPVAAVRNADDAPQPVTTPSAPNLPAAEASEAEAKAPKAASNPPAAAEEAAHSDGRFVRLAENIRLAPGFISLVLFAEDEDEGEPLHRIFHDDETARRVAEAAATLLSSGEDRADHAILNGASRYTLIVRRRGVVAAAAFLRKETVAASVLKKIENLIDQGFVEEGSDDP